MHFEKAAVLFNLASVLTQQALNSDRASDAGRKDSARKFQVCPPGFALRGESQAHSNACGCTPPTEEENALASS